MGPASSEVREAWAEWIRTWAEWEWFATLTFRDRPGRPPWASSVGWASSDRAFRRWVSWLAGEASAPIWWVRAREPHQLRASTHFHCLLAGVGELRRSDAWEWWWSRYGMARIEPVGGAEAVSLYVSKYVLKSDGEVVLEVTGDDR